MRHVDLFLSRISIRKHNALAAQAGLKGIKMPFRYVRGKHKEVKLPPEQEELVAMTLKRARERVKRERGNKRWRRK